MRPTNSASYRVKGFATLYDLYTNNSHLGGCTFRAWNSRAWKRHSSKTSPTSITTAAVLRRPGCSGSLPSPDIRELEARLQLALLPRENRRPENFARYPDARVLAVTGLTLGLCVVIQPIGILRTHMITISRIENGFADILQS